MKRQKNAPNYDTPAKRVLKKLGMTPTILAAKLRERGRPTRASTVMRWGYTSPKGTGGYIPQIYHRDIMEIAADIDVEISASDLLFV